MLLFLCVCCYCKSSQAQTGLIVRLHEGAEGALRESVAAGSAKVGQYATLMAAVEASTPLGLGNGAMAYVLTVRDTSQIAALVARWQATPGVAWVQPNRLLRLDRVFGPRPSPGVSGTLDSLAHLVAIGAPEAWQRTEGVASVRVGVVDTGLWLEHPAFEGQVAVNAAEDLNGNGRLDASDLNGVDDDGNGYVDDVVGYDFVDRGLVLLPGDYRERDGDPGEDAGAGPGRGHGTAVAGAIAARQVGNEGVRGVAPGARLVVLRAFGADGLGEDDDVAAAIVYAANAELDVLNLSFGDVYESPVMQDAIAYAASRGVTVVTSGGNDGMVAPHYPSDYAEVISVAWLTQDGLQWSGRGSRSPGIDLGAPGSRIYTTLFRPVAAGKSGALYGRESGSSMSAPLVSGAAALLRSLDPTLSPAAIRSILTASARDIEAPGWDEQTGAGLVRVDRALAQALPAKLALLSPLMDGGSAQTRIPIVATALDPAFARLHVEYAPGAEEPFAWVPLIAPRTTPALADTVAFWNVEALAEGLYTLKLRIERRDGTSVEERARVQIDRSAPAFVLARVTAGLGGGRYGVVADVETDDRTDVYVRVGADVVRSDRVARRHGLFWSDASGGGKSVAVEVVATNGSGLSTTYRTTVALPAVTPDAGAFALEKTTIPAGFLLPEATDFDGDGWPEVVLNQAPDGALGDTLAYWESMPAGFVRRAALIATVIPRSSGDTDGDGRGEVLGQIQAASLLLEARQPGGFPDALAFVDTTGLRNTSSPNALYGALLADLDGDGRGEIIGHNTQQVRILERRGDGFAEVARLNVPGGGEARFSEPDFRVADFDGNGRPELAAPTADGRVLAWESTGDDTYALRWTIETGQESLRSTLATGDVDGDGRPELLTFSQNQTTRRSDREQEPAVGTFRLWHFPTGMPDSLTSLTFFGAGYPFAGAAFSDLDGDGRDELTLGYPPDLYVFSFHAGGFALRFHAGDTGAATPTVVRSPSITTGDFDRDGRGEMVAAFTDGWSYRLAHRDAAQPGAPRWLAAFARNDSTVVLHWEAVADSVAVFAGASEDLLAPLATVQADSLVLPRRQPGEFALRAWRGGATSAFSAVRRVVPHAAGRVVAVRRAAAHVIEVEADVWLAEPDVAAARVDSLVPLSALLIGPKTVRFAFGQALPAGGTVAVTALRDTSGTPVAPTVWPLPVLLPGLSGFYIVTAERVGPSQVRLQFSAPLDLATVLPGAFEITPAGTVTEVVAESAETLLLAIAGISLRPTGLDLTIRADGLRSADGRTPVAEGAAVLLNEPAIGLAEAFVFPNPVRAGHDHLTLGGVPAAVEAVVLAADGTLVRRLETDASRGGLRWDLRDEAGAAVPSGVYLIRLTAPGSAAVLLKAALIR